MRVELFAAASARLAELGYQAIGIDHFALSDNELAEAARVGTLRRNFQGYTVDSASALIAFGASSISHLPEGYAQNATAAADYRDRVKAGGLATARGVALVGDDRLRGAIIERLMCDFRVDLAEIAGTNGASANDFAGEIAALEPLVADDIVRNDDTTIAMTEAGRPLVRVVAAVFDRYYSLDRPRHARAL
jgi:oxygen-independent coproporphyrinogen-3 oxidase